MTQITVKVYRKVSLNDALAIIDERQSLGDPLRLENINGQLYDVYDMIACRHKWGVELLTGMVVETYRGKHVATTYEHDRKDICTKCRRIRYE